MTKPLYKRILLKLSGESLQGNSSFGIEPAVLDRLASEIKQVATLGVEIGIVIGGGNLFRGAKLSAAGLDRITGDQMGMLATIMNGLALQDALTRANLPARMMSAIKMAGVVDQFDRRKAMHHLESGRIMIFCGGAGIPLFTTDSTASLRAIETNCDVLLKATNVDGIYNDDPRKNPNAIRYETLTYEEALKKELAVMDLSAFCQSRDHGLPIRVFNINEPNILLKVVTDTTIGTTVS